ncbi:MAG: type IV pili twitching motility protein PilT [Zetaproteobacteria bacterium CG12_big_fil_rev_8_21_14_0_65_54_13]|nr:MAG: type IV pili twitching motility protein PilT [Zetaproteobacteria bacterium CG12_big_fil_rev_8_21_14_0_65_54_13]PIX55511.1 MAG: type IV pili twitching motility protein PilT [Zetaproteobacteria bacterium CG_4_10_14_3_um_filter_54_28]PJA27234.1 MAG: type IV pili twitching motility protein PilT [Zetaproteobacteria bacterium CG_4_9_14_3_um_filter_54_145]
MTESLSIRKLLAVMVEQDASDLYLMAGAPPGYRINGNIRRLGDADLSPGVVEKLSSELMSEKQKADFADEMEMNLSTALPGMGRFRVNIYRQRGTVGMVIRQITTDIPSIDQLGLPQIFKDIVMSKRGLVLMVGATGSGKSSSLASMIDHRNSNQAGHIITIEDPIEFMHLHKKCFVTQREVGSDTISFQKALKNTLRQAPDVILLGEIRERDTMEHAIAFAETGHLAMSTLHANNANQALERILNFFPKEQHEQISMNLSMNLRAILSQRLVKTVDGKRVAAIEILINTPRIADLILKGGIDEIKTAMAAGGQQGMQTFDQALLKLWKSGTISEVEALRNADSANNLRLQMKMDKIEATDGAMESMLSKDPDDDEGGFKLSI